MKSKNFFSLIIFYLLSFIIFTLIFLLLFQTNLFPNNAFFYRGIKFLFISSLLTITINLFLRNILKIGWETFISAIIIAASIHLSFFIVFPVTFERSVTMYLLNTLNHASQNQSCPGYQKEELENKLIKEYILKNKALDKRIKEQSEIDFIKIKNNCVFITDKTKRFLKFSEVIQKLYAIEK